MEKAALIEQTKLAYDDEGDVLYISFGEGAPADDSDVTDEGILVRLRDGRIVGLTILNAAKKVLVWGVQHPAACQDTNPIEGEGHDA